MMSFGIQGVSTDPSVATSSQGKTMRTAKPRTLSARAFALAALSVVLLQVGVAGALYPPDGTKPDGAGYMNPNDGMCVIGVALDGTMLVDWSITNARDCVVWTNGAGGPDLRGYTQSQCTDSDNNLFGGRGYKHAWSTSICWNNATNSAISRVDLDNTDAMCRSKGGTVLTTGKCIAYGWVYRNRKPDGTLPVSGTGIGTTDGVQLTDGLGFCYASMRMTGDGGNGGTYISSTTCPSMHNSRATADPVGGPYVEWPDCLSSATGCQTQTSYNDGLGWSFSSSQCVYAYGVDGVLNSTATRVDGTTIAAGTAVSVDYSNQGDCLANGFAWDNWLPNTHAPVTSIAGMPTGAQIRKLDALNDIEDGGGDFYSGTGAVCQKCHSDQSRSYAERDKPGFVETRHKLAGDAIGKPFQPFFTAANSDWGLDGVQCAMCHSTAKPAQDDLIQVNPAGAPNAGLPKSATGHNNTEYGSQLIAICFTCHGQAASPDTTNPASVIPAFAGEFDLTDKGLEPIANQFLNSPHAEYSGTSAKVDVGNKDFYGSSFGGFVCRTPATQFRSNASPGNSQTNCQAAGLTWYTSTGFGNFCYYNEASCLALSTGQWTAAFDTSVYPWAAAVGGPGGLCYGVGIGSILTTVYRSGEAEKIHNLDSALNPACTNPADGSATSGAAGYWVADGETSTGIPADTSQGNCMTCHDVHWAIASAEPEAEPLRRECTTCHMNSGASVSNAPQVDLVTINHIKTAGTPLENWATHPDESCESCHMPLSAPAEGDSSLMHLWRISTDPNYVTMGVNKANLDADGKAWVDIDHACGQCHGGGTSQDAEHMATPPALYRTRATLATIAVGMHDAATVSYPVTFTIKVTGAQANVNAVVNCGAGVVCPAFTYDWAWGDATANGSGNPTSHTYASAGKRKITLTVLLGGKSVGSVSRSVTVANAVDLPPVASATCVWDANTWTATVTDTSTDTDASPVTNVKLDWGDSSGAAVGGAGAVFTHTYLRPSSGGYPLTLTAIDSALKSSSATLSCTNGPVAPANFTITGKVFAPDGTTPLAGATVKVKRKAVLVRTVSTAGDGSYSTGSLKPGTYKLVVVKSGYSFDKPAATETVGGSKSNINVTATAQN